MQNNIKVTVSCLAFNHEKYIRDALEGFIKQKTNFKYEVIIHDDASTDNTAKIIKEYEEKYPDIIKPIYQTENQWSKGVKISSTYIYPRAKGEYVALCEGDDYWTDENKLQMQVDFLDGNSDYSACCHLTQIYNTKKGKVDRLVFNPDKDVDIEFKDVVFGNYRYYQTSSLMVRKEYLLKDYDFRYMVKGVGDYPLGIVLTLDSKIRCINKLMSTYRFMSTDFAWSTNTQSIEKFINHHTAILKMLKAVEPYTSKEQKPYLKKAILNKEYVLIELSGDYKKLKTYPYKQIFKKKKFSYKFRIFLKQYFSFVYKIYSKTIKRKGK